MRLAPRLAAALLEENWMLLLSPSLSLNAVEWIACSFLFLAPSHLGLAQKGRGSSGFAIQFSFCLDRPCFFEWSFALCYSELTNLRRALRTRRVVRAFQWLKVFSKRKMRRLTKQGPLL